MKDLIKLILLLSLHACSKDDGCDKSVTIKNLNNAELRVAVTEGCYPGCQPGAEHVVFIPPNESKSVSIDSSQIRVLSEIAGVGQRAAVYDTPDCSNYIEIDFP